VIPLAFIGPDVKSLEHGDPEVAAALIDEVRRQNSRLQLVASENFVSSAVLAAAGSVLMNKFAEGYPGARYCGGCEHVDIVESLGAARARVLFGADHANLQPHSGSQANMAAYLAVLEQGDPVLAMDLAAGGHLTHGAQINFSGRWYDFSSYGVRRDTELVDYDGVRDLALRTRPRLIVAGATAYPRRLDFEAFRSIADEVGAYLLVDAAHILGLVAGGAYPNPVPFADIVTSTTYKVLRGPRGGMIMCTEALRKAVDRAVFPGIQGGPHSNMLAAKAVALGEASQPAFSDYAHGVVAAGRVLADGLADRSLRVVSGGTDCHLVLADLGTTGLTGREAELRLESVGIVCNKNAIPFDTRPPLVASGIRLGVAAMTTAGMPPEVFDVVADLIVRGLRAEAGSAEAGRVSAAVRELIAGYPGYLQGTDDFVPPLAADRKEMEWATQ
jgi:glycine hydroxymethyltransferase